LIPCKVKVPSLKLVPGCQLPYQNVTDPLPPPTYPIELVCDNAAVGTPRRSADAAAIAFCVKVDIKIQ